MPFLGNKENNLKIFSSIFEGAIKPLNIGIVGKRILKYLALTLDILNTYVILYTESREKGRKMTKVNGLIERWASSSPSETARRLRVINGKADAATVAELRELKSNIIAELKRREDEFSLRRAEAVAIKASHEEEPGQSSRREEYRASLARWRIPSGWEASSEAGELLESGPGAT